MDPLVEMSKEEWLTIRDSFKAWWPHGVPGYYALQTQIQKPGLQAAFGFTVYCPYGNINNGVVVQLRKGLRKEVLIYPNSKDTTKLEEALVSTRLIDWLNLDCIPFCDMDVVKLVKRIIPTINSGITLKEHPTIKHFLPKDCRPYDIQLPPETYVSELKPEHSEQVNLPWPHRYPTSERFFQRLIENGHSYGLFSKDDNRLVSWIVISEVGFLAHLYTEKEYREKHYGEFIVKYAVNDQLKKGNDIFCYILDQNMASMSLFRKLNFEVIGRGVWIDLKLQYEI